MCNVPSSSSSSSLQVTASVNRTMFFLGLIYKNSKQLLTMIFLLASSAILTRIPSWLLARDASPTPVTNSTPGVTILPPNGTPPNYTLMMPDPRTVLSSTAATIIACNSESIRYTELGKFTCLFSIMHCLMLSFLVFGAPTLNPSGINQCIRRNQRFTLLLSQSWYCYYWYFCQMDLWFHSASCFNRLSNIFIQQHNAECVWWLQLYTYA